MEKVTSERAHARRTAALELKSRRWSWKTKTDEMQAEVPIRKGAQAGPLPYRRLPVRMPTRTRGRDRGCDVCGAPSGPLRHTVVTKTFTEGDRRCGREQKGGQPPTSLLFAPRAGKKVLARTMSSGQKGGSAAPGPIGPSSAHPGERVPTVRQAPPAPCQTAHSTLRSGLQPVSLELILRELVLRRSRKG